MVEKLRLKMNGNIAKMLLVAQLCCPFHGDVSGFPREYGQELQTGQVREVNENQGFGSIGINVLS